MTRSVSYSNLCLVGEVDLFDENVTIPLQNSNVWQNYTRGVHQVIIFQKCILARESVVILDLLSSYTMLFLILYASLYKVSFTGANILNIRASFSFML